MSFSPITLINKHLFISRCLCFVYQKNVQDCWSSWSPHKKLGQHNRRMMTHLYISESKYLPTIIALLAKLHGRYSGQLVKKTLKKHYKKTSGYLIFQLIVTAYSLFKANYYLFKSKSEICNNLRWLCVDLAFDFSKAIS